MGGRNKKVMGDKKRLEKEKSNQACLFKKREETKQSEGWRVGKKEREGRAILWLGVGASTDKQSKNTGVDLKLWPHRAAPAPRRSVTNAGYHTCSLLRTPDVLLIAIKRRYEAAFQSTLSTCDLTLALALREIWAMKAQELKETRINGVVNHCYLLFSICFCVFVYICSKCVLAFFI